MKHENIHKRIGYLLKKTKSVNETVYKGLNINQNTFLQKLVPVSVMEKRLNIMADDYFTGLVFADYMANVITGDSKFLNNLNKITKSMRESKKDSRLDLSVIVAEAGLYAQGLGEKYFTGKRGVRGIKRRYLTYIDDDLEEIKPKDIKNVDPYYEAIGMMVCDMYSDDYRKELGKIDNTAQLKALLFTDCVSRHIKDNKSKRKIKSLVKKDYIEASLVAIDDFRKEVTVEDLAEYISELIRDAEE
ncbi:MAG: hypothetical protein ACE5J7_05195 [Candidatus Aenigmatarchaeota archaeon]